MIEGAERGRRFCICMVKELFAGLIEKEEAVLVEYLRRRRNPRGSVHIICRFNQAQVAAG